MNCSEHGFRRGGARRWTTAIAAGTTLALGLAGTAQAAGHHGQDRMSPGNLVVSTSDYHRADITPGVTVLPPGCTSDCATATADGTYPYVFNNDLVDPSFGVASPIVLDQISPTGRPEGRIVVPPSEMVTSFSSKSELSVNRSTSGRELTFMGYVAPLDGIDVSNSNTPAVVDPTNPVSSQNYRAVGALSGSGRLSFTETNAYSGNNGRAAIANDSGGRPVIYTAGNAGNGSGTQPPGILLAAGAQILDQRFSPEHAQSPGTSTPVGSFSVTQLGDQADKLGKDDNFRGETIFDNVLYYTKGSGSNGVNTVYFVDTTGKACPNGVGVPQPGAKLPRSPLAYDPSTLATDGLPSNMCVLRGFPTALAKSSTAFPFGIWFANAHTLFVADEGNGNNTYSTSTNQYTTAAAQTTAGLQKWTFDASTQSWKLAYTLQQGLQLGQPYQVPGYPLGDNAATGLPWAPATDGLRNITGRVNRDGTVTIWGVTSTISGGGDQGADPNQLVSITDSPSAGAPAPGERFETVMGPRDERVVRGVSLTPDGS
jgi:hypothetical protein